jgi:hypothetical protein
MAQQSTLALAAGFEKHQEVTRRAEFLGSMNVVVPWRELCAEIEPFYPKPGNGRLRWAWNGCCVFTFCRLGSTCPIRAWKGANAAAAF